MGELLTPTHLMVLAAVAILLFGGRKLPDLGKGLGESLRGFRDGIKGPSEDVCDAAAQGRAPASIPDERA